MSGRAGVAPSVDVAPEALDRGTDRLPSTWRVEDVLDHARDDVRAERRRVDLADALDAVVGDELQEDEVAAAEMGRGVPDDECLELGDLHRPASQNTIKQYVNEVRNGKQ